MVGHSTEEQLAAALPDPSASAARLVGSIDPRRHPHLFAALDHLPAPHQEEHFDFGLSLVIDGIRRVAEQVDTVTTLDQTGSAHSGE